MASQKVQCLFKIWVALHSSLLLSSLNIYYLLEFVRHADFYENGGAFFYAL